MSYQLYLFTPEENFIFNPLSFHFKKNITYVIDEALLNKIKKLFTKLKNIELLEQTFYKNKKYDVNKNIPNKNLLCIYSGGGIGDLFFIMPLLKYLNKKYNCLISIVAPYKEPFENLTFIKVININTIFPINYLDKFDFYISLFGVIELEKKTQIHAVDLFFKSLNINYMTINPEDKIPELVFTDKELSWLQHELSVLQINENDFVIGIQMTSNAPIRSFPKEKMKIIVDEISKKENIKILLIGHNNKREFEFYQFNNNKVIPVISYSLRQTLILANRYNLVIAPDSMMIQVAGSLNKPVIGWYGPFPSISRIGYFKKAFGIDTSIVCGPCCNHNESMCKKGFPSPCFQQEPKDIINIINNFLRKQI